ncbi:MAG: hypothetical protein RLZZ262_2353 [Bacteroidota bacterium]
MLQISFCSNIYAANKVVSDYGVTFVFAVSTSRVFDLLDVYLLVQ